jgi:DNA-directed RNA polymerase specialized sigma24 family protein
MSDQTGTDARFSQTHWSIVLAAADHQAPDVGAALEKLCRTYWYPLYAFVRRSGRSPHDAQDLTQGFFAHLLRRDWLARVGPEKGKFRTFLLACLKNYLHNEHARASGPSRNPGQPMLSIDAQDAEERYVLELADNATPEKIFHRRWVAALVEQVKERLGVECAADGKLALFEKMEPCLGDRTEQGFHTAAAAALGMSEGALRVAAHRLRQRFGQLLRDTVAETLANPAEVDEEIRSLFTAWG